MSKSNFLESAYLTLVFNATAIPNLADNAASSPATNLSVHLHTADPGEAGTTATSECAYTSYAAVSVARTTGGWTVSGTAPTSVSPVATISFPAATGGSETASYFSVSLAGSTNILYSGTITPNIVISNGVTPQLTTASTITED